MVMDLEAAGDGRVWRGKKSSRAINAVCVRARALMKWQRAAEEWVQRLVAAAEESEQVATPPHCTEREREKQAMPV